MQIINKSSVVTAQHFTLFEPILCFVDQLKVLVN